MGGIEAGRYGKDVQGTGGDIGRGKREGNETEKRKVKKAKNKRRRGVGRRKQEADGWNNNRKR